jgi:hypothetical protein
MYLRLVLFIRYVKSYNSFQSNTEFQFFRIPQTLNDRFQEVLMSAKEHTADIIPSACNVSYGRGAGVRSDILDRPFLAHCGS